MSKEKFNIAIVGATGVVGSEILNVLKERRFPIDKLVLCASYRSAGKKVEFKGEEYEIVDTDEFDFSNTDIALFSAGGSVSAAVAPRAASEGCIVIDNTSHFRMDPDVPLVVPEVNPYAIGGFRKKNIIANPNCSTIQLVVVLKPIHRKFWVKRAIVSTYQAVSGAGKAAMEELTKESEGTMDYKDLENKVFDHQIAYNCIPHIDVFQENGYTREEMKMYEETKKILGDEQIKVSCTCVRVPVFVGHSESVMIETEKTCTVEDIRELLSLAPGVELMDDPMQNIYPMPLDVAERDEVFVGRIRKDLSVDKGISLWVVGDNLRKGAALNAVQIAEVLIKQYLK